MSKSGAVWHKALLKMLDKNEKLRYNIKVSLPHAGVMELADVADSKSAGATRTGSSPVTGTMTLRQQCCLGDFCFVKKQIFELKYNCLLQLI
jgi:hypothetical protein